MIIIKKNIPFEIRFQGWVKDIYTECTYKFDEAIQAVIITPARRINISISEHDSVDKIIKKAKREIKV